MINTASPTIKAPVSFDFEAVRNLAMETNPKIFERSADQKADAKKQGGIKDLAVGRSDVFQVKLSDLYVKPDWNSRDLDNPENQEHVLWLAENITENGVREALEVTLENGKLFITDGHCRYFGAMHAIAHLAAEIHTVPVRKVAKGSDAAEHILSQILRNSGKRLTSLETGVVYVKLLRCGMTEEMIAKKVSKTVTHVNQLLALQEAPREIKDMVRTGKVSATAAFHTLRTSSDAAEATKVLEDSVAEAEKEGKGKATNKHISKVQGTVSPKAALKSLETQRSNIREIVQAAKMEHDVASGEHVIRISDENWEEFSAFLNLKNA